MIHTKSFCMVIFIISLVYCNRHVRHSHHNVKNIEKPVPNLNCIISGHFYCKGRPSAFLRPYISSPEYIGQKLAFGATHKDGWFLLSVSGYFPLHEPVLLEVRHVCRVKDVPPEDHCAFPYYTTSISVDHRNKTSVDIEINLDELSSDATSFCL